MGFRTRISKCCGRTDPDFIDAVNRSSSGLSDTDVNAEGYKNVIHYINQMEYAEQKWKDKIRNNQALKYEKDNFSIAIAEKKRPVKTD